MPKKEFFKVQANTIIKNLEKRNMEGHYCETKEEAKKLALSLMKEGSLVSWGGSMSLNEIGLIEAVKASNYQIIDRNIASTPEEKKEVSAKAFLAEYYMMSTNAITLDGELVNIDGNGNRVACLIYGPENVIIVAGMNKVVKDVSEGIVRTKNVAAPPNTIRLNCKTPCATTGVCADCFSQQTICCQEVVTRFSRIKNRIKVILVGEELGF